MDILTQHYPNDDHILIFDNATTHLKRADNALSACKMPKLTPKDGCNWGVEVTAIGSDGKPLYRPDGKPEKTKVQMSAASFSDGSTQELYFLAGHPRAGVFKGMVVLLEERGFGNLSNLHAECKGFKCDKGVKDCCCRRILYEQPDFIAVESLLETACKSHGFRVLFLPKFHCELNFIEQCWVTPNAFIVNFQLHQRRLTLRQMLLQPWIQYLFRICVGSQILDLKYPFVDLFF